MTSFLNDKYTVVVKNGKNKGYFDLAIDNLKSSWH